MKPVVNVAFALLPVPFPCTRSVAVGAIVYAVVSVGSPSSVSRPLFTKLGGAKVPALIRSESAAPITNGSGSTVPAEKVTRGCTVGARKRTVGVPVVTKKLLKPDTSPACRSSSPFATVSVRPAVSAIVPVFVKLGLVPDCVTVRFPVVRLIVPAFTCAASACASVSAATTFTVP